LVTSSHVKRIVAVPLMTINPVPFAIPLEVFPGPVGVPTVDLDDQPGVLPEEVHPQAPARAGELRLTGSRWEV